ncbi:outer membrane lipoprotein carrier protein LolA [Flaviflagellibacter deserti]|uniref:Outer membrane lipoprotein carrier protein LolA n=2 Tax=Flaviflagellibacter deserti TaxID=2267266 RepID=A0ABV9Z4V1_9HYPH
MPQPRPARLTVHAPAALQAPVAAPTPAAIPVAAAEPVAPADSISSLLGQKTPVAPANVPTVAAPAPPAPVEAKPVVAQPAPVPAEATRSHEVAAAPVEPPPPVDLMPSEAAAGTKLAAVDATAPESSGQQATIRKVNDYFNSIRTLVGSFTQVGPDGSRSNGKFFLSKPGKARFYYQRPSNTDIIADGSSVVVRDRSLATQDIYPLSQTPLKFLLDPNLDLSRDSKVVGVNEDKGVISVQIEEETTFGGKARVLIVFATEDQKNYELKQWTITDAQGLDTTIAVSELDPKTKPDEKLFKVDYTRYRN